MISYRVKGESVAGWKAIVEQLPVADAKSPFRSTLPLLDFWRGPERALGALSELFGDCTTVVLEFEHQTCAAGRGKASHTDLMIRTKTMAVAVEAKSTEPRYQTVRSWLRRSTGKQPHEKGAKDNRTVVLEGWLRMLPRTPGKQVTVDDVSDLPYQLIHRAAAACAQEALHCVLAYHVFGELKAHYRNDLTLFSELLGSASRLAVWLCHTPISSDPVHERLANRWRLGERDLSDDVKAALLQGPLFQFARTTCIQISRNV